MVMRIQKWVLFALVLLIYFGCAPKSNDKNSKKANEISPENKSYGGKGIGPINNIELALSLDSIMIGHGESIFREKCSSCHLPSDQKSVGPGLYNVTTRRKPEWILNMILNPMEMTQKDSLGKELLNIFQSQMLDNNLTQLEARQVLEYLRTLKD